MNDLSKAWAFPCAPIRPRRGGPGGRRSPGIFYQLTDQTPQIWAPSEERCKVASYPNAGLQEKVETKPRCYGLGPIDSSVLLLHSISLFFQWRPETEPITFGRSSSSRRIVFGLRRWPRLLTPFCVLFVELTPRISSSNYVYLCRFYLMSISRFFVWIIVCSSFPIVVNILVIEVNLKYMRSPSYCTSIFVNVIVVLRMPVVPRIFYCCTIDQSVSSLPYIWVSATSPEREYAVNLASLYSRYLILFLVWFSSSCLVNNVSVPVGLIGSVCSLSCFIVLLIVNIVGQLD